ncbi:MAG: tetratricopeptide repeat protein [Alphaproteobacteria bacterium]
MALILHCGGAAPVRADPFEDATWAYEAGDYRAAVTLWRPLAQKGDARAQLVLGVMHREGHGVAVQPLRAHMWLNIGGANGNERAAELRDRLALNLTVAQVLKAQAMAREWADEYPKGGVKGRLGPLSPRAAAASQFARGTLCEGGDAPAQRLLGEMHMRGEGMPSDPVRAHMWLNLAGADGEKAARAQRDLIAKTLSLEQIATAQQLARRWLDSHDRAARPVEMDEVRWRLDRAQKGDVNQMFLVGMMYDIGHDVAQDYAEAFRWYHKAAEQGHVGAQYNLGAAYYLGYGVPQDYVEAHKWFSIANVTGLERAIVNRDIMTKLMTPDQIAEAQELKRDWMARPQTR